MSIDISDSDGAKITQDVDGLAHIFGTIAWFHSYDVTVALTELMAIVEEYFNHNKET